MKAYHELLQNILDNGNDRGDRTGTGTRSIFGAQIRHDLRTGFPLLTTKKMSWKPIVIELLWFLKGDTNIKYLLQHGVHIWTADAYRMYKRKTGTEDYVYAEFEQQILNDPEFAAKHGDLGPVYGKQWRMWEVNPDYEAASYSIDQIKNVIESIRKNPEGRRHIVTAWNPAEVDNVALPPCHCLFQFYVHAGKLSCHLYQRSADVFLGVPFNIASYALLTHIIAHQCGLDVGDLIISFGDIHAYRNHIDQIKEQLTRDPKPLPKLNIRGIEKNGYEMPYPPKIDEYEVSNFGLVGYDPHPAIKGELSVGT